MAVCNNKRLKVAIIEFFGVKVNSDGKVWWESSRSEDEYFQPQTRV